MSNRRTEIEAAGPLYAPYPGWVQSEAERQRWRVCAAISLAASIEYEPDGRPDARFVWYATRGLYNSDEPTGDPDPEAVAAIEAYLAGFEQLFP